jgi:hypothetical protein
VFRGKTLRVFQQIDNVVNDFVNFATTDDAPVPRTQLSIHPPSPVAALMRVKGSYQGFLVSWF